MPDDGSPGQELRLPQHSTGDSGHFGDCEGGRKSEDKYPSTDHPGQSLMGGQGGPMAGIIWRNNKTRICGFEVRELQGRTVT